MSVNLKITLTLSMTIHLLAWSFAVEAEDYTFGMAWQEIQQISDVLAAERANVERSELLQEATKSLNYPQVDLSGSYTVLDDPVVADALAYNPLTDLNSNPIGQLIIDAIGGEDAFKTDITNRSFGRIALTALWPIYTGGRITAAKEIGAAQTDIANQMFDITHRTVFEELVKVYFGVVLAQQNLETHRQLEAGFLKHLGNAQALEREGQIAKVERMSIAVAYDQSRVKTLKSLKTLEIAQVALRQLLHSAVEVFPTDPLFTNATLPPDQRFISTSLGESPLLRSLNARDRELQAIEKASRGRYYPEVFLFADVPLYKDNSILTGYLPDWSVGVGFKVPLHDRYNRSKNIGATLKAQESVARLSAATRRVITVAVEVAYKEAEKALAEFAGLSSSLDLAKENLRLREAAFKEGFSTATALIDAQLFISVVRMERSAAAYHYIFSLAQLLALSGEVNDFGHYQSTAQQSTGSMEIFQ